MKTRVLLEFEEMQGDTSPEVFFYHFDEKASGLDDFYYLVYASSSDKNGRYDIASVTEDSDGDGDIDKHDKKLYLQLADVFAQFKGFQAKR
ncbi:hypothetical protein [Pseudomonas mandelii]|uniref:hypothetical protein n=1 Tax=Pseudomonas mandelii TaxID=75612 RepID=UPI00209D9A63|nr:hypothetical protein [Pseudomonas mandelii]MCO8314294.1 hypothetical protein [Pseudomonas mandelii]